MYSTSKGNVHGGVRQSSRKKSSPQIIKKKTSVSRMEGSPKDSSLQSWSNKLHQGSPQIISVSGSYSEVSASDFIQQCILNLPAELGTPVERCPLPKGSDDFQKVMKEFTADETKSENILPTGEKQLEDDSLQPGEDETIGTGRSNPRLERSRHFSEEHTGQASHGHPPEGHRRKKRISTGSMGPLDSVRSGRKQAGQWMHQNVNHSHPAQLERSSRKGLQKMDDIFNFSSDEEDESTGRPRLATRHQTVRRNDSQRSLKDSDLLISG